MSLVHLSYKIRIAHTLHRNYRELSKGIYGTLNSPLGAHNAVPRIAAVTQHQQPTRILDK
jgi:hypothetical protein